ncbi:FecCD family ABC transporter permease [Pimelobacter simplex]|uniref:FecCD family ABC transporter permease n=1 Tax=Nocardioides simplex TaxID=2045 RepID=UPI00214FF3A9|nr:iron ABC transporter permease [Pimelobacter simplex]UUW92627.1 iron ABC transporter permease [Pimelobacter simplex]UUW96454.1 iron ABC transporter permease [Pimelobacter simplex]
MTTGRTLGALLAAVALATVASLCLGGRVFGPVEIVQALWSGDGSAHDQVIRDLRVPRTVVGLLVGAALGLSGALMQGLTRNPLADPGILGVNAGAALGVALAITQWGIVHPGGQVWFALAGAALTTLVVAAIGRPRRGGDVVTLTLSGVAVGAVLTGITSGLVLLHPRAFDSMRSWNAGSITVVGYDRVLAVLPFIVAGVVIALALGRSINALALGDDTAQALGVRLLRTRVLALVAVTLLCGAATAAAGPIVFVGLMVPHIVAALIGPDHRRVMTCSLLAGPVLVLGCDLLGRYVAQPRELPVGVVAAAIGAVLLAVVIRRRS